MNLNLSLLNVALKRLLDHTIRSLVPDRHCQVLGHLLAGDADKRSVELKALVWLECDVDLLL